MIVRQAQDPLNTSPTAGHILCRSRYPFENPAHTIAGLMTQELMKTLEILDWTVPLGSFRKLGDCAIPPVPRFV